MTANELRGAILDLVEWAVEDGMPWWEAYGVISSLEKYLELTYKADLLMVAKETPDES